MSLPFVRKPRTPISIDFGAGSLRALQLEPGSERAVSAACEIRTPPELLHQPKERLQWQTEQLPRLLKHGRFSGKRAVCSIAAQRTIVEHLALAKAQGVDTGAMLNEKLRTATGIDPAALVVRHEEIGEVTRNNHRTLEALCFAIPRATINEHMRALRRAGLDTVGVHCEHAALARAMKDCTQQDSAETQQGSGEQAQTPATLLLDLGASGVRAAVVQGAQYISSRTISADLTPAVHANTALAATGTTGMGAVAPPAPCPDLDHVSEELGQCLRYCAAVRPDAPVKQAVFVGGLSASDALCADLARRLRLPARAADPLSTYRWPAKPGIDAPSEHDPKPAWAVALGLCLAPTDL